MEEYTFNKCPVCGIWYADAPAISRRDNETEICPKCGTKEALEDLMDHLEGKPVRRNEPVRKMTPYERTKATVYASGNKWAIENFEATH